MRFFAVLLTTLVFAGPALAKPPLSEVKSINDGLLAVGIADEIRNKCDDIAPRMIRAMSFLHGLVDEARSLGYTDAEIEAFRKSPQEKARLRAQGEAYLAANGVKRGDRATLCHLGRVEIARGSQIGRLLKTR